MNETSPQKNARTGELPTARILIAGESEEFDINEVPIAFANDLWEEHQKAPTPHELAAIALALYELLPKDCVQTNWQVVSKLEAISNRL